MRKTNHIMTTATLLKSLGHPIRIQIILALSQKSVMTVTELSKHLLIEQPVMSLHLGVLRKQKVIKAKKDGKQSEYSLFDVSVKQIVHLAYYTRD